jgi:hypothetical protein
MNPGQHNFLLCWPFITERKTDMITDNYSKVASSFNWLNTHLDRFTPWRSNQLSMEGLQSLSELAIIYARIKTDNDAWKKTGITNQKLEQWEQHIITILEMPAFYELARKRPLHSFPYILPYLVMRSTGYKNIFLEETLEVLLSQGFPKVQEVVPFRELDLVYFFNKAQLAQNENMMSVYHRTFMSKMKSIIHIDNESAYSITHTILYLSDFGKSKLTLPATEMKKIQEVLESLAIHFWRLKHWDLLGELLFCLSIIGIPLESIFHRALTAFYNAHEQDGSITGRQEQHSELLTAQLAGNREKIFTCNYHTTIVSFFLSFQIFEQYEIKN